MVARGLILGLDGQSESFDGLKMETGNLLGMALFCLKLAEVKAVRPVHEVDWRQNQKRGLPSDVPVQEVDQPGDGGSDHVIRKRPEIAFGPDLRSRFAFSQPDDGRHGGGVKGEVRNRCAEQSERSRAM